MRIIELFKNGFTMSLVAYILGCDEAYILSVIAEQKELSDSQKEKLKKFLKFLSN